MEEAAVSVIGGESELSQSEALRQAILKRLDELDAGFMVSVYFRDVT